MTEKWVAVVLCMPFALAVVTILFLNGFKRKQEKILYQRIDKLKAQIVDLLLEKDESNQGFFELADSYEQQFISYREKVEAQEKSIKRYEEDVATLKAQFLTQGYVSRWPEELFVLEDE